MYLLQYLFITSSSIHYNSCLHFEASACKFAFIRCGRSHTYHSVSFTVITDTTSSRTIPQKSSLPCRRWQDNPHRGQATCDGSATRARALLAPRSLRVCVSLLVEMGWPLPLLPPLPHTSPQHTSGLTCHHWRTLSPPSARRNPCSDHGCSRPRGMLSLSLSASHVVMPEFRYCAWAAEREAFSQGKVVCRHAPSPACESLSKYFFPLNSLYQPFQRAFRELENTLINVLGRAAYFWTLSHYFRCK